MIDVGRCAAAWAVVMLIRYQCTDLPGLWEKPA
jgi:hypothetical protein